MVGYSTKKIDHGTDFILCTAMKKNNLNSPFKATVADWKEPRNGGSVDVEADDGPPEFQTN